MTTYYIRRMDVDFPLYEIDLFSASDEVLKQISEEQGIGLSIDEMKRVRAYFAKRHRNPTDVELQSIGQAWSEHCCYKSSKIFLRKYLFPVSNKNVNIIDKGDAGVVEFDSEHAYALKMESHNHPSAIEPYGGAATGIGGIVRDIFCMGAQPIALLDPLFFGPLDYPEDKLPPGIKHPKYLFSGVVAGIRDYGNRIGIPTVGGCVFFDESYIGNCLVNVACVGITRKSELRKNAAGAIGEVLILLGGLTGRDGIHGVTFASAVLTEASETKSRGAVQLGDPIVKEPLIHVCLEANRAGLISGLKDLGGGGLSCVVGELALAGGFGAEVELDRVPLKEEGLAPWEIWVSESQERMMLSVKPENVSKVLELCELYDVTATPIGRIIRDRVVRLFFNGTKVFELELDFLTKGPEYRRPYVIPHHVLQENIPPEPKSIKEYNELMLRLLASPNIACKDWVIRQYDHEVRAATAIKPLQGLGTHGDAVVLKPLENSFRGLALAVAHNPRVCKLNPFIGGQIIIDELCRNLLAVGAKPHTYTNCLNFGNPEIPERLGEFREVVRGLAFLSKKLGLPTPSGNVSFYNESELGAILPTATVVGAGIVEDIRYCTTVDFKQSGNPIYLVEGRAELTLGGSEYLRIRNGQSSRVTAPDCNALKSAIELFPRLCMEQIIIACHDISDGGLATAIAEMCIGGGIGCELDIMPDPAMRTDFMLFSETATRWVVELRKNSEKKFTSLMRRGLRCSKLGLTGGNSLVIRSKNRLCIDVPVKKLYESWAKPLWKNLG